MFCQFSKKIRNEKHLNTFLNGSDKVGSDNGGFDILSKLNNFFGSLKGQLKISVSHFCIPVWILRMEFFFFK